MPHPSFAPFIGRTVELAALTQQLDAAATGRPQTVVVQGAGGVGKSRLVDALIDVARRRGCPVGVGRGWPDGDAPDLWPWRSALSGLGLSTTAIDDTPTAGSDPSRFARFTAVLETLRAGTGPAPFVVVLDDATAADAASLRLAAFLARQASLPLLQILVRSTADTGAAAVALDALAREAAVVELEGLPPDEAAAFLRTANPAADAALVAAAASLTRGNPLHLRSLTGRMAADGLAGSLTRAITAQIARLAADDRRLLAVAALLGTTDAHQIARVGDAGPTAVVDALARAGALGLVDHDQGGGGFPHAIVRAAIIETVAPSERLALHARAAAALVGDMPDVVVRRAHHAIEAAAASPEAAARAIPVLREAAAILRSTAGFDAAASLLGRAVRLQASVAPEAPAAALAVEHAEAVLASGRLTEARLLFQAASRAADREGDPLVLARAALGLGGVWISEHRLQADVEATLALQTRAHDALPADAAVLRARLAMRLAAETAYRTSAVGPVLTALAGVRATDDAPAIAEALSLAHHVLLTPEHVGRRLVLANEQIAAASRAGDDLLSLVGVCWRAVDLFALGHARAPAALEELRLRATALGCRSLLFIASAIDVMRAIREGAFERAEADAAATFALGQEVGDADALAYRGAHVAGIRYFQGRETELVELTAAIAESPTLIEQRERTFAAAATLFAWRAGRPEPARALLDRIARDGIASIPTSSSWLTTMAAVAELALLLDDARVGQAAYGALLRYAHLPVMASLAVVCFGSAHRPLAQAALACGNVELAVEHLNAAVVANQELGHRPATLVAKAELGLAKLRRRRGHDDAEGRALVAAAIREAEPLGMSGLVARWRAATPAPVRVGEPIVDVAMARLDNGSWRVAIGDQVATVPDRVGLHYLRELVDAPGRAVPALALVLATDTDPSTARPDPIFDAKAIAAVRDRIATLRRAGSPTAAERDELVALERELSRATGLGGRLRAFTDAPERARTAVRKALKRAIDDLTAANPVVGRHLADHVETGTVCCYHRHSPA